MVRIQAARRTMSMTMVALGGLLLGAGGASAETFTTPGTHLFTVPAGATSIYVKAIGANGGGCWGALGGRGASLAAIVPVTGGEQLRVVVGGEGEGGGVCPGSGGGAGGTGGGGHGGAGTLGGSATGGAGGGGASLVGRGALSLSGMLVVAGGGGGSAYLRPGGNAGFPGGAGSPGTDGSASGTGGRAGTQSSGGAGGAAGGSDSTAGSAGAALTGGDAGNGSSDAQPGIQATSGGGGGGGGYYGGGGGGGSSKETYAAGGGGGSSFITTAATWTLPAKPSQGPAQVTITYPLPLPTATISAPGTGTSFTVGSVVPTTFSCEGVADSELDTCTDSTGTTAISAGSGRLDTSTVGAHTYTVTATTIDGRTGTQSIAYTVVAAPPGGGSGGTAFALTSLKAIKQALQLKLRVPAAGTVRIAASAGKRVSCKAKKLSVTAGAKSVRVKLCAKAIAALKKLSRKKKLKFSVTATYSGGGKTTTAKRTVKVPGMRKGAGR